ncbi:hypothetical protein HRbin40_00662 [bacterium HR40]|nr:hypothetical protein HRbin40_00662 [bacterium HR40]
MFGWLSGMGRTVGENELQAYVDGRLSERRRRRVEAHLAQHPEDAARLADYGRQLDLLRGLREQPADFRHTFLCYELVRAFDRQLRQRRRRQRLVAAAAVLLLGSVATAATFLARLPGDLPPGHRSEEERAWLFHPSLMSELPSAGEAETVGWLRARLGHRVLKRPDLEALGLRYVSGVVLHDSEPPVVRFAYEDELGKRLFVYVAVLVGHAEGAFGVVPEGYVSLQFRRGPVVFALVAPSDSPQLTAAMEMVSAALIEEPVADSAVAGSQTAPAALADRLARAAAGSDAPSVAAPAGTATPSAAASTTDPL